MKTYEPLPHFETAGKIDLSPFTSTDPKRKAIKSPWRSSGFTLATTGKINIMLNEYPEHSGFPMAEDIKAPPILDWLREIDTEVGTAIHLSECKSFKELHRKRATSTDCSNCDGHGTVTCDHREVESDCVECDTSGIMPEVHTTEFLGFVFIDDHLIALNTLPNCVLYITEDEPNCLFTFDGGQGSLRKYEPNK